MTNSDSPLRGIPENSPKTGKKEIHIRQMNRKPWRRCSTLGRKKLPHFSVPSERRHYPKQGNPNRDEKLVPPLSRQFRVSDKNRQNSLVSNRDALLDICEVATYSDAYVAHTEFWALSRIQYMRHIEHMELYGLLGFGLSGQYKCYDSQVQSTPVNHRSRLRMAHYLYLARNPSVARKLKIYMPERLQAIIKIHTPKK